MDAHRLLHILIGWLVWLGLTGPVAAETPAAAPGRADDGAEQSRGTPPGHPRQNGRASADSALPLPTLESETAHLIEAADMSVTEVLDHVGLTAGNGCLDFSDPHQLLIRKRRWSQAIRLLAHTHPDKLYGWLLGRQRPPETAEREARLQRNCMLDQLVDDSLGRDDLTVNLEFGERDVESKRRLHEWARAYRRSSSRRRRMRRVLTESRYRSALSQGFIWRRKYLFQGRNFNRISPEAAEQCRLTAGHTWKPDLDRHERCWEQVLTGSDREREILSASSAPGVSRHHWGTEFDLFGLNPHHFRKWGHLHDEYEWMVDNALSYGFFQSYGSDSDTYMEERWHWSYFPIAQALTDFASNNDKSVDHRLNQLWNRLQHRFNRGRADDLAFFDHIRDNWRPFMFDITVPTFGEESDNDS